MQELIIIVFFAAVACIGYYACTKGWFKKKAGPDASGGGTGGRDEGGIRPGRPKPTK